VELLPREGAEQRHGFILESLARQLDTHLLPRRIELPDGSSVLVDGVGDEPPVLVEAWAHRGAPKSGQRNRVLMHALKLSFVGGLYESRPRLILAFCDHEAARLFRGQNWYAGALRQLGVEVMVVESPDGLAR
jgi:hypothetical protein